MSFPRTDRRAIDLAATRASDGIVNAHCWLLPGAARRVLQPDRLDWLLDCTSWLTELPEARIVQPFRRNQAPPARPLRLAAVIWLDARKSRKSAAQPNGTRLLLPDLLEIGDVLVHRLFRAPPRSCGASSPA
jgi:hypothetical protein